MANITIDENGQILIPREISQSIGLQNHEWLRVSTKSEYTVLTGTRDMDSALIEELIRQGVIID